MRLCAALALVLVVLVVVTVRTLRRPHRRATAPQPEITELAPPPPIAPPPAPGRATPAEAGGIAHLSGRVLFPAGAEVTDDVVVVAEDLARRVNAQVLEDGRFDLHLPAGHYTLIASAGELVGVVPNVLARAEAARDVDIPLGAGAAIRGKVRGPGQIAVAAAPTGRSDESGLSNVEDGAFSIAGLIPGHRYDLSFSGDDVRKLTLTGITAPTDGLEIELQARAVVSGAIGFPRGATCPIDNVALQVSGTALVDEDDEAASASVGKDCSFAISVPDQTALVTVVATGEGWHLEEQVAIPAAGDPERLCLNPPCRDPNEGFAHLWLTLDGADADSPISATATATGLTSRRPRYLSSCHRSGATCDIAGLTPGDTFSVEASGLGCESEPRTITLVAGDNHVHLPCYRQRQIEGVIRVAGGEQFGGVSVRCPGGEGHPVLGTRLFHLSCRADAVALEYRIDSRGDWRSVAIASADDPAFVDIAPL